MHYSSDNPITRLLDRRQSTDWAGLSGFLTCILLFVLTSGLPDALGFKLTLVLSGAVYGLLRAACDSAYLSSWRKSRTLEAMLISPLSALEVVDGVAYFSLRKTAWVASLLGALSLFCGAGLADGELLWLGLVGPLLLLLGVFALLHLSLPGPVWWGGLALLCSPAAPLAGPGWPVLVLAALLLVGIGARDSAARNLLKTDEPPRAAVRAGVPAVLWSENPIIVRELRREARAGGPVWLQRHGGFLLLGFLMLANLLAHGPRDAFRCQLNACVMIFALLFLQTLRAALTTTPVVVSEREAGTLATLALTGLSAKQFMDGWALWSWRSRMLENLVGIVVALGLALWGAHLATLLPVDCTMYPRAPFPSQADAVLTLLPWALSVLSFTPAGAYLGLMASVDSSTHAEASGRTMLYLVALGLTGLALASLVSPLVAAGLGALVTVWARFHGLVSLRQ